MAKVWQVVIFATCSLAVGSICIQAKGTNTALSSSSMPYSPVKSQAHLTRRSNDETRRSSEDLATAASDELGFSQPPTNIYHSIIDRTASSNRMASPIQTSANTVGDLNTAAGHHHGHSHGKYYEYREVPKKKTWKFGYKRGNHKHHIERHEHGQAGKHPHFKTKVKWADKKSKGKGIHLWDYNHHDKKHYHHG